MVATACKARIRFLWTEVQASTARLKLDYHVVPTKALAKAPAKALAEALAKALAKA